VRQARTSLRDGLEEARAVLAELETRRQAVAERSIRPMAFGRKPEAAAEGR
jgi:hypothetical protein